MRWVRARGQRGAVLTEYVLLIGLIAIIGTTSEKVLGATASNQFSAAAAQLSGASDGSASASVAADSGSSGSSGTTDTTPSTTAAATTTTVATTTTTLAPVTTTTRPPVATHGSTDLTTPTLVSFGSFWWGTSQLIVTDDLGVPLSGARVTLQLKAYTRQWNGTYSWVTTTQTLTTDSDGSVGFFVGPYSSSVTQATVSVSAVTLPNGLAWDGDPSTITVNSP